MESPTRSGLHGRGMPGLCWWTKDLGMPEALLGFQQRGFGSCVPNFPGYLLGAIRGTGASLFHFGNFNFFVFFFRVGGVGVAGLRGNALRR